MKLSKATRETITSLEQSAASSLSYAARVLCGDTRLPDHINAKPVEFYEGQAHGFYMAIEILLFANKAYEGFTEQQSDVTSITASYPDGLRFEITTRYYTIK